MQKYSFTHYDAQRTSGKVQPYLPHDHVDPRVPRSINAKFHAYQLETVSGRDKQAKKNEIKTSVRSYSNDVDFWLTERLIDA